MRCSISLFSLAIVMVASACVGSDIVGPIDPPEPPVLQFITITGNTNSLMMGDTRQHKCVAHYNKGPEKDCTDLAEWTSSVPSVATVAIGVVTAVGPGDSQISASFEGKTVAVHISVIPLPVTLVSVSVVGDTTQERAGQYQYSCLSEYSDGSRKVVSCGWSYDDYLVGEVNSLGVVKLKRIGVLRVTANHEGLQGSLSVRLTGTPWSELPAISDTAKALVPYLSSGEIFRWDMPLALWAGLGIPTQNIQDAFAFWMNDSSGKVQFVQVADSADAKIKMYFDAAATVGVCAWGGTSGIITINPASSSCVRKETLAHEMGRTMGFPTMPPGTDIMSTPSVWKSDPTRQEATIWTYSVPRGTIPIDG